MYSHINTDGQLGSLQKGSHGPTGESADEQEGASLPQKINPTALQILCKQKKHTMSLKFYKQRETKILFTMNLGKFLKFCTK